MTPHTKLSSDMPSRPGVQAQPNEATIAEGASAVSASETQAPVAEKPARKTRRRRVGSVAKPTFGGQMEMSALTTASVAFVEQEYKKIGLQLDVRTAIEGAWTLHGENFGQSMVELQQTGESERFRDYVSRRRACDDRCRKILADCIEDTSTLRFRLSLQVAESLSSNRESIGKAWPGTRYHDRDILGMVWFAYGLPLCLDVLDHFKKLHIGGA